MIHTLGHASVHLYDASSVLRSLSDGVSGPARTEKQQPKGPQQSRLPVLQIHQDAAVSQGTIYYDDYYYDDDVFPQ